MIGTPEQPWIDTDPFLNIDALKALEPDIIRGLCLSDHGVSIYGNLLEERHGDCLPWIRQLHERPDDDPDKQAYKAITDSFTGINRSRAQRLFVKLRFGAYSGGSNVSLRVENVYKNKNRSAFCVDTPNAKHFPTLMAYIKTLPFVDVGRVTFFVNDHDLVTPIHTDDYPCPHTNDFFWLRTNLEKKFFIYDPVERRKSYVTSHTAFFNEQLWHGTDPSTRMTFSLRVDGVFSPAFKQQLGIAGLRSYW